jgi:hypothetical protein
MTKLTETQATILATAAQHPDGIAAPPASLPPAPRGAVAKAMVKAGLLKVAVYVEAQHPGVVWKLDGEAVFLCITDAGRAAIGSETETTAEDAQGAPLTAPDAEPVTGPPAPPRPPRTRPRGCRTAPRLTWTPLRLRARRTAPTRGLALRPSTTPRRPPWRPWRAPGGCGTPPGRC